MNWICKLFGCKTNCDSVRKEEQAICGKRIDLVHRNHEADYTQMVKDKNAECEGRINAVHKQHDEAYLSMVKVKDFEINKWIRKYNKEKSIPKRPDFCKFDECPFKPNNGNGNKKKLKIHNNKIYYGDDPIKLCGVSRWEALWRETGEFDKCGGWGQYNLAWYENELKESGINYVRHAGIKNTQFLYDHCKRMKDMGIIVEVTVFRAHKESKGALVNLLDMGNLAKLGNVFFDVCNEFLDAPGNVGIAIDIAQNLQAQGCIVSGGAWSGVSGKDQFVNFHERYMGIDIETHHREWHTISWQETLGYGKPVLFNEFFSMKANLTLEQTKAIMNSAFATGCAGCQYYGFRWDGIPGLTDYDDFDYKEMLNFAGSLVK